VAFIISDFHDCHSFSLSFSVTHTHTHTHTNTGIMASVKKSSSDHGLHFSQGQFYLSHMHARTHIYTEWVRALSYCAGKSTDLSLVFCDVRPCMYVDWYICAEISEDHATAMIRADGGSRIL
jgi:hypothetical protein